MLAWMLAVLMLVGGCAALYAYADDTFRVSLLAIGVGGVTASLAILINHAERRGILLTVEQGQKLANWQRVVITISLLLVFVGGELVHSVAQSFDATSHMHTPWGASLSKKLIFVQVFVCSMVFCGVFLMMRGYVALHDKVVIANQINKGGQWLLAFVALGYGVYYATSVSNLGYLLMGAGVAIFTTGLAKR